MNLDEEKKIIDTIRRCQRNWDLNKSIPKEHIDHWIYIAQHSPSKQDESYFNLYVITNKEKIKYLLNHTWGHTLEVAPGNLSGKIRNPQVGANAYFLSTFKLPNTIREQTADGKFYDQKEIHYQNRLINGYTAIGISMGLIAQSAARLGYKTGFNACHGYKESPDNGIWKKELGICDHESIALGLGIGYPQEGRKRNEHDETKFLIGEYPPTEHSIYDEYILIDGIKYPTPKIDYILYSVRPKNIKVFRFE